MEEKNKGRKKLIRNIAIIFFTVMLFLTLFSNTIMNLTLPQVTVSRIKSGTIYNKVRGNGKVEAVHNYEIKLETQKKIARLCVSEGDTVSENQLLFVCEEGENEELKAEEEALAGLQLEYEKSLLELGNEYGIHNITIQNARDQLLAAMEEMNQATADKEKIAGLKQTISQKEAELAMLKSNMEKAQEKLAAKGSKEDTKTLENEIQTMNRELDALSTELGDLSADLQIAVEAGNTAEETRLNREIRDKEKDISYKQEDLKAKKKQLKAAAGKNEKLEELEESAKEAKAAYESASAELEDEKEKLSMLEGSSMKEEDARANVKEKEIALKTLILEEKSRDLEFDYLQEQVRDQEQEVEKLKENDNGNEIYAPVAGVIREIYASPGDTVLENEAVLTINMIQEGYTVSFPVTLEQSNYVAVGNKAAVLNVWDESTEAELINIKADPDEPNKNKILTFKVQGEELTAGQSLAISVGDMQQDYDTIVPVNAVYEDNQGEFVYRLSVRTTPLGNRYMAERKTVQVLARDDTYAAILSDLSPDDYIITESMEPIEDGMKVRLVD